MSFSLYGHVCLIMPLHAKDVSTKRTFLSATFEMSGIALWNRKIDNRYTKGYTPEITFDSTIPFAVNTVFPILISQPVSIVFESP